MFPIPTVLTAPELVDKAFRRASKATGKGTTKLERGRRGAVAKVQTLGDTIDTTLKKYGEAVPSLERLPDFPRELVDLLVGIGNLKHDLGAIDWCREQVLRVARHPARQATARLEHRRIPHPELRLQSRKHGLRSPEVIHVILQRQFVHLVQ